MTKPKRLPVFREDRTIEIPLTRGYVAIVDWEDAWVCNRLWYALHTPSGHIYACCSGKLLHREILGYGPRDGTDVDHKNGDTLNCRRENLRAVPHSVNLRNRKLNSNNASGHAGVCRSTSGRWKASLSSKHIGEFATIEEAVSARLAAEYVEWGVHPRRAEVLLSVDDLV